MYICIGKFFKQNYDALGLSPGLIFLIFLRLFYASEQHLDHSFFKSFSLLPRFDRYLKLFQLFWVEMLE